jgi:four helix bundle protein
VGTAEYKDLVAYRRAIELSDELYRAVAQWDSFDRWTLGSQLVRAADLIGANVAEAAGRWYLPDRRRLLLVARGSLHETEHWIPRAEARGLLPPGYGDRLAEAAGAVNGLIKKPAPR